MIHSPDWTLTLRWLIRDTFRQALASGIFWIMLGISLVCICVCLSVRLAGDMPLKQNEANPEFLPRGHALSEHAATAGVPVACGQLTLAFGAIPVPIGRDRADAVRYLQLILAGGVADSLGLLLALVWTAGFLPSFLEPHAVAVLLAKPTPRWRLLAGKYLGALAFVALNAFIFILGTWLALGLRTGVWDATYLLCVPLLFLHFAIFYSFSTILAVTTRSTVTCVFGTLLLWLVCWGMNYGRHALRALPEMDAISPALMCFVEIGYWVLPKPADFGILLFDALHAQDFFTQMAEFKIVQAKGAFHPLLSLLSSLLSTLAILGLAAWEFDHLDY